MIEDPTDTNPIEEPLGDSADPHLPAPSSETGTFWSAAVDLDELELPPRREFRPTLERLVPSPFPRSGFPLIGFLATIYDHVAAFARTRYSP